MGQVGALIRISEEQLENIKKTKEINWSETKEIIDVDRLWEPIMFIFGRGFLGREPFVDLFMAKNCLYKSPEQEKWDPSIRFHSIEDLKLFIKEFESLNEEIIRSRINIEKINSTVMYPISETDVDLLVKYCLDIIEMFKLANNESDSIVTTIG